MTGRPGVDGRLASARARLTRLSPRELQAAIERGALVVDIRPDSDRLGEGSIPGSVPIGRNVLEWRLDPGSPSRLAGIDHDWDRQVVVVCNEGYASSLAAVSLQEVGLRHATDLDGGHRAWAAAGLPVRR